MINERVRPQDGSYGYQTEFRKLSVSERSHDHLRTPGLEIGKLLSTCQTEIAGRVEANEEIHLDLDMDTGIHQRGRRY